MGGSKGLTRIGQHREMGWELRSRGAQVFVDKRERTHPKVFIKSHETFHRAINSKGRGQEGLRLGWGWEWGK